jgi:hypothetical protein
MPQGRSFPSPTGSVAMEPLLKAATNYGGPVAALALEAAHA